MDLSINILNLILNTANYEHVLLQMYFILTQNMQIGSEAKECRVAAKTQRRKIKQ